MMFLSPIFVINKFINNANKTSGRLAFYGNQTAYQDNIVGGNTLSWTAVNNSHDQIKMKVKVIANNGSSITEDYRLSPPLGAKSGSLILTNNTPPINYYIEGTVSDYVNYGDTPDQWIAILQYEYERQDN